ncbi:MAG: hypothetical protein LBN06_08100 [Prevotellaceae bacterium]|jgi:hypothetical protein|nr:hypothetical protein [Prevotellaceae bacterium]
MNGREDSKLNDLFFVCSLIEYIARQTKNRRAVVVNAIGKERWEHIYELAEVYHSENMDKLTYELTTKYHIETGTYDNVAEAESSIPTHWDIGKVYQRLIHDVVRNEHKTPVDALMEVFNSWIVGKIDNYNSSMYYENPSYLYASYQEGRPL